MLEMVARLTRAVGSAGAHDATPRILEDVAARYKRMTGLRLKSWKQLYLKVVELRAYLENYKSVAISRSSLPKFKGCKD